MKSAYDGQSWLASTIPPADIMAWTLFQLCANLANKMRREQICHVVAIVYRTHRRSSQLVFQNYC